MKLLLVAVCLVALASCVFGLHPSLASSSNQNRLEASMDQAPITSVRPATTTAQPRTSTSQPTPQPRVGQTQFGTCWVGQINRCTGESAAWSDATPIARATTAIVQASLRAVRGLPSNIGFGLVEAESESQTNTEAEAEAESETESSTEVQASCGSGGTCRTRGSCSAIWNDIRTGLCAGSADIICCQPKPAGSVRPTTPTPAPAASSSSRCSGTCQARSSPCGTRYQTGLCPGSSVCCVAASSSPSAPAASSSSAFFTGVSSRTLDPTTDIINRRRTITWAMLTREQQTNARLLVQYAKRQSINNINALAYILGTAHWECHLKPIREWHGSKKRYAPYYGRGFVQLTWRENYAKFTSLLKSQVGITADLVRSPDLALNPTNAAFIAAYGMKHGTFTSRRLDQYFTSSRSDFVGARAIINGSDKAQTIATLSRLWVNLARALYNA